MGFLWHQFILLNIRTISTNELKHETTPDGTAMLCRELLYRTAMGSHGSTGIQMGSLTHAWFNRSTLCLIATGGCCEGLRWCHRRGWKRPERNSHRPMHDDLDSKQGKGQVAA